MHLFVYTNNYRDFRSTHISNLSSKVQNIYFNHICLLQSKRSDPAKLLQEFHFCSSCIGFLINSVLSLIYYLSIMKTYQVTLLRIYKLEYFYSIQKYFKWFQSSCKQDVLKSKYGTSFLKVQDSQIIFHIQFFCACNGENINIQV